LTATNAATSTPGLEGDVEILDVTYDEARILLLRIDLLF
jgi:hypothetical protein